MNKPRSLLPACLALAALAYAAPANAAPPWSAPTQVTQGRFLAPILAFAPDGSGVVFGIGARGTVPGVPSTFAVPVAADGSFGDVRRIRLAFSTEEHASIDQRGRVLAVGYVAEGRGRRLAAATGRAGGPLGRPRRLEPDHISGGIVAVDSVADGRAVVARQGIGTGRRGGCRRAIYLVVRAPGRRFGQPQRWCAGPRVEQVDVAMNERGDVLVAWARSRRVYARMRTARGRLGRIQRIGIAGDGVGVTAVLGGDGQATVAWSAQRRFEAAENPYATTIGAAVARPGRRFGSPRLLERYDPAGTRLSHAARVQAQEIGGGQVLLAWKGQEAGRSVVRSAEIGVAGAGPSQTVSSPVADAEVWDLAVGPAGEAVVGWREYPDTETDTFSAASMRAAARPAGATAFGAPEAIADSASIGPDITINPLTRRPVAVWDTVDAGGSRVIVWSASRDPVGPR